MKSKWFQKKSNIITLIICIILIPILLMNLSIIIQANVNKDKVPSVFGYKPFMVLSGSMESKIHKGDLIIVKTTDPSTLKKNNIIAFQDDQGTVTTHRIIDIVVKDGESYFITKGDNNDSQDQKLVEYKDVEGIYQFRIPQIGNLLNLLAEPTTIIIIILGITVVFAFGFYTATKKETEKERAEFLEYKRQKELLEQQKEEQTTKEKKTKTSTGKKDEKVVKTTTKKSTSKEAQKEVKPVKKATSSKTTKKTK